MAASLELLRRRIDELIAERFLPRLLVAVEAQHVKHGHKTACGCESCEYRRREIRSLLVSRPWRRAYYGDNFYFYDHKLIWKRGPKRDVPGSDSDKPSALANGGAGEDSSQAEDNLG